MRGTYIIFVSVNVNAFWGKNKIFDFFLEFQGLDF
jgi:hypothetical protein